MWERMSHADLMVVIITQAVVIIGAILGGAWRYSLGIEKRLTSLETILNKIDGDILLHHKMKGG